MRDLLVPGLSSRYGSYLAGSPPTHSRLLCRTEGSSKCTDPTYSSTSPANPHSRSQITWQQRA